MFDKKKVKSETIQIRCTKDEKAYIKELADKKDMTISEYIFHLIKNR